MNKDPVAPYNAVMLKTATVKTSGYGECWVATLGNQNCSKEHCDRSPVMLNSKAPSREGCPSSRVVPSKRMWLSRKLVLKSFRNSSPKEIRCTVQAVMRKIAQSKPHPLENAMVVTSNVH